MAERDPFFDNSKFVLVVLIVLGHLLEIYLSGKPIITAYIFLYLFHIPCFVMISGYFSKNADSPDRLVKLFGRILVPYFIFEALYSVFKYYLFNEQALSFSFMTPYWIMWYMLSLFCWNLMMPLFSRLRYPIAAAILVGVASGYFSDIGYYLSLSRTFVFFPFFIIGYYLKREHFDLIARRKYRLIAVSAIIIIILALYAYPKNIDYKWLHGSYSYQKMGSYSIAWVIRLSIYAVSLILSFCFFSLMPGGRTSITSMGERIIYVYLLHGFLVKSISVNDYFKFGPELLPVELISISILISIILSSDQVYYLARYIVSPQYGWLIRKES